MSEDVAAQADTPAPRRSRWQQFGGVVLLIAGAMATGLGYYMPLATVNDGRRDTYSLADTAHYGTPGVSLVGGGAPLLGLLTVVVIVVGETRARLMGILALAIAEAIGMAVVATIGVCMLPVARGYHYEDAVSFGPALLVLVIATAAALTGAIWWSLQTWTGEFLV
ncbi:hypothetical protein ACIP5Y_47370 [Nocardia sp. NPDC088792]|uniref:hypothetical protein n=1 Tax=Nocardia sp. NPDC088792 TaxID=3364332 RepID=UPI0037FE92BB